MMKYNLSIAKYTSRIVKEDYVPIKIDIKCQQLPRLNNSVPDTMHFVIDLSNDNLREYTKECVQIIVRHLPNRIKRFFYILGERSCYSNIDEIDFIGFARKHGSLVGPVKDILKHNIVNQNQNMHMVFFITDGEIWDYYIFQQLVKKYPLIINRVAFVFIISPKSTIPLEHKIAQIRTAAEISEHVEIRNGDNSKIHTFINKIIPITFIHSLRVKLSGQCKPICVFCPTGNPNIDKYNRLDFKDKNIENITIDCPKTNLDNTDILYSQFMVMLKDLPEISLSIVENNNQVGVDMKINLNDIRDRLPIPDEFNNWIVKNQGNIMPHIT